MAFLSLIAMVLSLFWFQKRVRALPYRAPCAQELVALKGELENTYLKLCAFSLVWFWANLYFRAFGSVVATFIVHFLWLSLAYVLYRNGEKYLQHSGWKPEKVHWARVLRFWGVVVGAFVLAQRLSRGFDAAAAQFFVDSFGPAYFGSGGSIVIPMILFLFGMFLFVALSPLLIALAFPSKRESDSAVIELVKRVFARGKCAPPFVLRLDTGKSLFAAVAGLLFPVLFLSDSLVRSLTDRELEAVVAHELTHVQKGHLKKRVLWFFSLFVLFVCYCSTLAVEAGVHMYNLGWVSLQGSVLSVVALSFLGVVGLFWTLRKVVREQEAEADAFAVAYYGADASALVSALDKVLAASGRSRNKQPWISYIFPAAAHPTVEEREAILHRAVRRARFGIAPLRTRERAFVPYTGARRLALASLSLLCLWMVPMGFLRMYEREVSEAFRYYSELGDLGSMKYFIARGANPKDPKAFFRAVGAGKTQAVSLLVEFGADPNWSDPNGASAFELAWRKGHKELAAYLDRVAGTHRPEVRAFRSAGRSLASQPAE